MRGDARNRAEDASHPFLEFLLDHNHSRLDPRGVFRTGVLKTKVLPLYEGLNKTTKETSHQPMASKTLLLDKSKMKKKRSKGSNLSIRKLQ